MKFDIKDWLALFTKALHEEFGSRILFVGLQGSYSRGESTLDSDIDIVVILDSVTAEDLNKYSDLLDSLPAREKACGFISGKKEISNWERSDLFQFYHDTVLVLGDLNDILPKIETHDILQAIKISGCNLYHLCVHNMVHEKSFEILKELYKSARFTVQAIYFIKTGNYIKSKLKLMSLSDAQEQQILKIKTLLDNSEELSLEDFTYCSSYLMQWASNLISKYNY